VEVLREDALARSRLSNQEHVLAVIFRESLELVDCLLKNSTAADEKG
jgi:hypothetical protein